MSLQTRRVFVGFGIGLVGILSSPGCGDPAAHDRAGGGGRDLFHAELPGSMWGDSADDPHGHLTEEAGELRSAALVEALAAPATLVGGDLTDVEKIAVRGRLGARLSLHARDGVTVSIGGSTAQRVTFVPLGASSARAVAEDNRAVYPDAWRSTDLFYQVENERFKELLYLRDAHAPTTFAFGVEVGAAWHVARDGQGQLILAGSDGTAHLAVEQPFAVDATGRRVDLDWTVTGGTWSLSLPSGLAYPIVVDPTVGSTKWSDVTASGSSPSPRSGFGLAWDAGRDVVVMYGGTIETGGALSSETWEWNPVNRSWAQRLPASPPSARHDPAMAYVAGCSCVVLYGGQDVTGPLGDTYEYTNSGTPTWTSRGSSAILRAGAQIFDTGADATKGVILVGGESATTPTYENTVMAYSTSAHTWSDVTGTLPVAGYAFYGGGLVSSTHQVWVFGGISSSAGFANELYALSFNGGSGKWDWADKSGTETGTPSVRNEQAMAFYSSLAGTSKLVMFGGVDSGGGVAASALELDPATIAWTTPTTIGAAPPVSINGRMVFDATDGRVIMMTGAVPSPGAKENVFEYRTNALPQLTVTPPGSLQVNQGSTIGPFMLSATDADGDTLTFGVSAVVDGVGTPVIVPGVVSTGATTGTWTWTPLSPLDGKYDITFTVFDGTDTVNSSKFVINVNAPPNITFGTISAFSEGSAGSFQVIADDPDGDAISSLTFSFPSDIAPVPSAAPSLGSFSGIGTSHVTGTLSWTPSFTDGGNLGTHVDYALTFHAADASAASGSKTATPVTVNDVDQPPVLTTNGANPVAANETDDVTFKITATDPDTGQTISNLKLTSFQSQPAGQVPGQAPTFTTSSGASPLQQTFDWKTGYTDAGKWIAKFDASDNLGTKATQLVITINVTNVDQLPVVTSDNSQVSFTVSESSPLSFKIDATDLDVGDTIDLDTKAGTLPAGATFPKKVMQAPPVQQTFNWTPSFGQGGPAAGPGKAYIVTFTSTDSLAGKGTLDVLITVNHTDQPPVWGAPPPASVLEGATLTLTPAAATDADGDAITYHWKSYPAGAVPDDATRTLTWTPTCQAADSGGPYSAVITATANGASIDLTIPITVTGDVYTLNPSSGTLDFGNVTVGTTSSVQAMTITNTGSAKINLSMKMSSDSQLFVNAVPNPPSMISTSGTEVVSLNYTPATATPLAATITLVSSNINCPITFTVTGHGVNDGLTIDPLTEDYGDVRTGTSSPDVLFTAQNTGTGDVAIDYVTLDETTDFTLTLVSPTSYAVSDNLTPGQQATWDVRCNPTVLGALTGMIHVHTTDSKAPDTFLQLTCNGVTPGVQLSTMTFDYGGVDVQGTGASKTFMITNSGTDELTLTNVALSNDPINVFSITAGTVTSPVLIDPGASQSVTVGYQPTVMSASDVATLTFTTDADTPTAQIALSGRGIDRHIGVSPLALSFPTVLRDSAAGSVMPVTITNTGGADLAISTVTITGAGMDAYSIVGGAPTSVPANGSVMMQVKFSPPAAGSFPAQISISSDDNDAPAVLVGLTGMGFLAPLSIAPDQLTAPIVPVGETRTLPTTVDITNDDPTTSYAIANVCIAGSDGKTCDASGPFLITDFVAGTLAPMTKMSMHVSFAPTATALVTTRVLVFVGDDPDAEQMVNLSGQGDIITLSGGGCGVAPGGRSSNEGGAFVGLLLLVGLLVSRRRALAVVLLVAGVARADQSTSFDLTVFRPVATAASSFITVEEARVTPQKTFAAGFVLDFAKNPLEAHIASDGTTEMPVGSRTEMTFLAAYGIAKRTEVSLIVPLLDMSGSTKMSGIAAANGAALGDIALAAKFVALKGNGFNLAASTELTLPTGNANDFAGTGSVSAHFRAIAGVQMSSVRIAGNVGFRVRPSDAHFTSIEQGSELTYGGGVNVRIIKSLDGIIEVYGARGVGVGDADAVSPLEMIGGLRLWAGGSVAVTVGGGGGIVHGIGAGDLRLFAGLTWAQGTAREKVTALIRPPPPKPIDPRLDTDGDGIPDYKDKCPKQPEDMDGFQDADGCPDPDNDQDGVPDAQDHCPNVRGVKDYFGCTDADSDKDGIPDAIDKCPNEPEDIDGYQDQDGCDDPDNDKDGIPDVLDQCVNQPETINGVQDDDGCPDPGDSSVLLTQDHIELIDGVDFAGDSATIKVPALVVLEQVFATLRANPQIKMLQVQAYVDSRNGDAADLALSQKRGDAVVKYLTGKGVDPKHLEVKAFGSSKPKGKKRAQNDRIEFLIEQQDPTSNP